MRGWRGYLVGAALLAASPSAWAAEKPAAEQAAGQEKPVDPTDADLTDEPKAETVPVKEDEEAVVPGLRLKGRLQARGRADERDAFERKLGIASARLGVEGDFGPFRVELSADLAEESMLRDAFLSFRSQYFRAYVGQFKAPFLARQVTSSWDLPIVGRGMVEDYLVDVNGIGGRRLGALGQFRNKAWKRLELSVGVFEGGKDELGARLGEDLSGRLGFRPFKGLELGASAYHSEAMAGSAAVAQKTAGAVDAQLAFGRWLVSAEAVAGRIPLGDLLGQLGMVQYDIPLNVGPWMLQPAIAAEAMQLRGANVSGQGHSLTAVLGVHDGGSVKVQLQAERALRPGDPEVGHELALQVGARF